MATNNAINSNIPIEIAKGGTNATSMTDTDGVAYFDGTRLVTTAVGTATHVLTSNGPAVAPTFQAAGGGGIKVTTYTSSDTWTKDGDCQALSFILVSGGMGGGSGRRGASGNAGGGAGGCGPGVFSSGIMPAAYFGGTETVTIGGSGAGGAAQTVNSTNGNNGTFGGISVFGLVQTREPNGTIDGGTTGDTTARQGYLCLAMNSNISYSGNGGKGTLAAGGAGGEATYPQYTTPYCGSGAGGGAGANTGTAFQGGSGSPRTKVDTNVAIAGAAGGIETGAINGTAGTAGNGGLGMFTVGLGGGGGGGQKGGGVAGTGGAGGFPGGPGGGGGGSIDGTNSGVGGAGAGGVIYVFEYLG